MATRLDLERQIFDLSLQIAGLQSDLVYLAYSLLEYLLCLVPLFDSDRKGRIKGGYGLDRPPSSGPSKMLVHCGLLRHCRL